MSKLIVIFVVTLALVFVGQVIYGQLSSWVITTKQENTHTSNITSGSKDYFDLIEKQKQAQENQNQNNQDSRIAPKARGNFKVLFVLVKPNYLNSADLAPLVSTLKKTSSTIFYSGSDNLPNTSLYYVPTFYKDQAKKYNVSDFNVDIQVTDIYNLSDLNKVGDVNQIWGKDPFGVAKLEDNFTQVLKLNNLTQDKNTMVVFLFFDNSFSGADSDPNFYEHKVFRSFAEPLSGQAFINVYSFYPGFSKVVTEIAAHEILHLFGATDKYEEHPENNRLCLERGFGDVDKNPPFPQTSSDIMCGFVETSQGHYKKGDLTDETLDINKITAKEIGWTD